MTTCIGQRLAQIRGQKSQSAFAKEIGAHKNTIGGYERGERTPDAEFLRRLMQAGYNANWVIMGDGPMRIEDLVRPGVADSQRVYAVIPRHTTLEGGIEVDVESEIASLSFSRKWLEQKELAPENVTYIRMPDDSMKPTIEEGAVVVIDSSTDKIRGDGLYALLYRDVPTVKRLHMEHAGDLLIFNDNDIYSPERIDAEKTNTLFIIGKVIWVGGEV